MNNSNNYLSVPYASDDQAFRHNGQNSASLCLLHSAAPGNKDKMNNITNFYIESEHNVSPKRLHVSYTRTKTDIEDEYKPIYCKRLNLSLQNGASVSLKSFFTVLL